MRMVIVSFILAASPLTAETLVASRTLPAQTVIQVTDLALKDITIDGGETDPALFVGMETRVALYAGRPIRATDVGFPAVVDRNQLIPLVYDHGGLLIRTEGRALGRAGPGEVIRVMNMASRNTVSARIGEDGAAYVSPGGF